MPFFFLNESVDTPAPNAKDLFFLESHSVRSQLLSLGTNDILVWSFFAVGGSWPVYTVGCLASSLALTHKIPVELPNFNPTCDNQR